MRSLERYMSYRDLFSWLTDKLKSQTLLFRRKNPKVDPVNEIIIESESPNVLAELWSRIKCWSGFDVSEQEQIYERVSDIEDMLNENETLSFNELCRTGNAVIETAAIIAYNQPVTRSEKELEINYET